MINPLIFGPIIDIVGRIFDKVIPDSAGAEKAKLELVLRAQDQEVQLALKQIEVNLVEAAHPSIFVAGWRPAVGWICVFGLGWNFVGYPIANWITELWYPQFVPPALLSDNLLELVLGMLGMAGLRSWEKYKTITK